MSKPTDLQTDWPADAVNDELLKLAAELPGAVAPLPPDALARVQQQMQTELDRTQRRQQRRRVALGWSIAAAILVAIGGYTYFRPSPDSVPALGQKNETPEFIEDRITVALGDGSVIPATDKALVRLDENRSLFAD